MVNEPFQHEQSPVPVTVTYRVDGAGGSQQPGVPDDATEDDDEQQHGPTIVVVDNELLYAGGGGPGLLLAGVTLLNTGAELPPSTSQNWPFTMR